MIKLNKWQPREVVKKIITKTRWEDLYIKGEYFKSIETYEEEIEITRRNFQDFKNYNNLLWG